MYRFNIAAMWQCAAVGNVPQHLGPSVHVDDLHGQRALRSANTTLVIPTFKLSTVGSRICQVSGPRIWNELREDVVSALVLRSCCTFRCSGTKVQYMLIIVQNAI